MTSSMLSGLNPNTSPIAPPPPSLVSNFVGLSSAAIASIVLCSVMIAFEFFFIGVRLFDKYRVHKSLRLDDWCAIGTVMMSLSMAFVLLYVRNLGRHQWDISIAMVHDRLLQVDFAGLMILGPAIFMGKCCLLSLYYRIFSCDSIFRWKIYGGLVFSAATLLLMIPVDAALCTPPPGAKSWLTANPNCYKSFKFGVFQGTCDVLIDLYLLYLPIPRVMALRLPVRKRLGVIAIFMTGTVAIAASATALVYRIHVFQGADPSWAGYIIILCSFIETAISVICSSMPAMTAFSKSHVIKLYELFSLPSTVFFSKDRGTPGRKSCSNIAKSPAATIPLDSSEFLRHPLGTDYIRIDEFRAIGSEHRTDINAARHDEHPSKAGIFTTVRMEQKIESIV